MSSLTKPPHTPSVDHGASPTTEVEVRAGIRDVLGSLNAVVEDALRRALAEPIDLGHSERLQFQACPSFFGVELVQTDAEILADSAIQDAIPPELQALAEDADVDVFACIEAELLPWFADRWQAVGGPGQYQPAYLFFHGGLDEPRYDLVQRRWCAVSEVWPGET